MPETRATQNNREAENAIFAECKATKDSLIEAIDRRKEAVHVCKIAGAALNEREQALEHIVLSMIRIRDLDIEPPLAGSYPIRLIVEDDLLITLVPNDTRPDILIESITTVN